MTKVYHIVRNIDVKIGDTFSADNNYNYFAERLFEKDFSCNNMDVNQLVLSKNLVNFDHDESKTTKTYIYESCAIIRELVLENYRLTHCPNLPSRLKCLFACESLEQAKNWQTILQRMYNEKSNSIIVELEADGTIFKADGSLMLRNTYSINNKFSLAEKYWNSKGVFKEPEILFMGLAKVIKIYK